LRAAVEWSYDQLTGAERQLLGRLCVFSGWSLEMAEQVCAGGDIATADVLHLLTALIDKSLVSLDGEISGDARYRMLGTVREFAARQVIASGEMAALRVAHRDCMLAMVEGIAGQAFVRGDPPWPARVAMYHRVRADRANFGLALACCAERGDAVEGLRLCCSLAGSWLASGETADGAGWLDRMLALGVPAPPGLVARAHAVRAELAFEQQDYDGARAHAMACVGLSGPSAGGGQVDGNRASGLRLLALVALQAGQMDDALAKAGAAVESARQMADDWQEGVALAARAAVIAGQGRVEDAQLAYEQALDVLKDNNGWGVANALYGLGRLARSRQDPPAAVRYFSESLAIYRQIDARPEMARCLAGIGWVALSRPDLADARASLAWSPGSGWQ
jgi:Tetratricopeptide repeat